MVVDKSGHEIKPGQIVDVCMLGMLSANVMEIRENRIHLPGQPPSPPTIIVAVVTELPTFEVRVPVGGKALSSRHVCDKVYVVAEPPKMPDEGIIDPN